MKTFSYPAEYLYFQYMVKKFFRFIYAKDIKNFIAKVRRTSTKRAVTINKGEIYWRARIGSAKNEGLKSSPGNKRVWQDDIPYPPEEMKPPLNKAKEGRANPKGIPYFYLAKDKQTAIQEVRPWLNSLVTIAECQIAKKLKLIDCSKNVYRLGGTEPNSFLNPNDEKNEKLSNSGIEEFIWSQIDCAFSIPIDPSDEEAEYVPTQILAELFKANNYDGIIYNSLFAEGKNLVLFDVDSAKILNCQLYRITKIPPFEFCEAKPPRSDAIVQRVMDL
jgi:hypothetical protein